MDGPGWRARKGSSTARIDGVVGGTVEDDRRDVGSLSGGKKRKQEILSKKNVMGNLQGKI